jgi:hypothetical protein
MLAANPQTRLSPARCNRAVTEHTAPTEGDLLDSGVNGEPADPPYGAAAAGTGRLAGWNAALRPAAWLAAGVVAGAVVVAAWHSSNSTAPLANPAAAQGQPPNGQGPGGQFPNGQAPNGQFPNGHAPNGQAPNGQVPNGAPGYGSPGFGGPGFGGSQRFGRVGEQHVNGTVTAVGASSVTVRLANGSTATYAVIASSDIVKNGAPASLSAIKVGDTVFLHVYPLNGRTVVEHLFAGARPNSDPGSTTTTKT